MDTSLRALNRFGLGARIGERRALGDARGWLRSQLQGSALLLPPPDVARPQAVSDALRNLRILGPADARRREARAQLVEIAAADARSALRARVDSERPFVERLVAFWSNHLCVSAAAKILVAPLAGSYERDAIRPHVLGRFEDMVRASAQHPAMLLYLDNFQSIGPRSRGARAGRRDRGTRRGLNENYARELLELHTLGVNGGYSQQDVQELARVLTGWTVDGLFRRPPRRSRATTGGPLRFAFEPLLHEPGSKTVLGERYAAAGIEEGERAIRALCRHPSTARFIAAKLVVHFVSDEPSPSAIDRVAGAFRSSDGDLASVARTLIDLPEAWSDTSRKFRTPQDWVVAVLRAFRATEVNNGVLTVLRQLRHPLWGPPAPKGFGDTMQEWADPDSLLNRAELARTVSRVIGGRVDDPRVLLEVVDAGPDDPLRRLVSDRSIPATERVALAIASPGFQWR